MEILACNEVAEHFGINCCSSCHDDNAETDDTYGDITIYECCAVSDQLAKAHNAGTDLVALVKQLHEKQEQD